MNAWALNGLKRRPEVAEELHPGLEDEGDVPERLPEPEPVVAGVGIGELGELSVVGVPVDDEAADRLPVAADVLGGRVDDDVRPVLDGAEERGRGRGVVDDEGNARLLRDLPLSPRGG